MDFGYAFLVGLYFVDQASEDILDGDKSYIFISMYTLDFLISLTLLALFNLYSKKDEERLIKHYLITLQNDEEHIEIEVEEDESPTKRGKKKTFAQSSSFIR